MVTRVVLGWANYPCFTCSISGLDNTSGFHPEEAGVSTRIEYEAVSGGNPEDAATGASLKLSKNTDTWLYGLMAKTSPSQGGNESSILSTTTKFSVAQLVEHPVKPEGRGFESLQRISLCCYSSKEEHPVVSRKVRVS